MLRVMKRIFLTTFVSSVIAGCIPSYQQPQTSLQLPLDGTVLKLDVRENDQILSGDFLLLKSDEGYVSLQRASVREESERWGISTIDYLDQLYGNALTDNQEIVSAKAALSSGVIESKILTHERYFAVYQRESNNRERVFFTDKKKPSLIYYILETRGKDALRIFYGES